MEHEIYLTVESEVIKYTPAFSEDRPDWGQEHFPASIEFIVKLGDLDITHLIPKEELATMHDKLLEDYN